MGEYIDKKGKGILKIENVAKIEMNPKQNRNFKSTFIDRLCIIYS